MSTQNINSLKNNVYWYDIQIEISITKSAINQYWDIKPCVNIWNIRKSKANIRGENYLITVYIIQLIPWVQEFITSGVGWVILSNKN